MGEKPAGFHPVELRYTETGKIAHRGRLRESPGRSILVLPDRARHFFAAIFHPRCEDRPGLGREN